MLLHAGKHPDPNRVVLRPVDPKSKPRVLNPNASLINRKKKVKIQNKFKYIDIWEIIWCE